MNIYIKKIRSIILMQIVFSMLWTLTNVLLPYINIMLFDNISNLTIQFIIVLCTSYFILILLNSLFQYIYQSLEWKMSTKFRALIQEDLFKKVVSSVNTDFYQKKENEYLSYFNNDVEVIDTEYLSPLIDIIRSCIELLFYTIALVVFVNWRIAFIVIVASTCSVFIPNIVADRLSELRKEQLLAYESYFNKLGELLKGISLITPFTFLGISNRHTISSKHAQDKLFRFGKFKTFSNVLNGFVMFMISFSSFIMVCLLLYQGQITIGAAVATFSYIENFVYPIRYILTDINSIHSSKKTKNELENWLSKKEIIPQESPVKTFSNLNLLNVKISVNDFILINNLSLIIQKGEKIAVIGNNGSGKSTLLKAIANQKGDYTGKIIFNDSYISRDSAEEFLFYCDQNPIVFNDTLKNNVTIFDSFEYKKETSCYIPETFKFKPEDIINPQKISGGEKQIISFLRAINTQRGLLILDEPFSSLNKETAYELSKKLCSNKELTIIMVTHEIQREYLAMFTKVYCLENHSLIDIDLSSRIPALGYAES